MAGVDVIKIHLPFFRVREHQRSLRINDNCLRCFMDEREYQILMVFVVASLWSFSQFFFMLVLRVLCWATHNCFLFWSPQWKRHFSIRISRRLRRWVRKIYSLKHRLSNQLSAHCINSSVRFDYYRALSADQWPFIGISIVPHVTFICTKTCLRILLCDDLHKC